MMIPTNCTERIDGPGAVVYSAPDATVAIAYIGKAQKHTWFYRFKTREQRDAEIKNLFDGLERRKKAMDERKAARAAVVTALKVGDILYDSWGYDQTNVDFYQVVAVSATRKTVDIVEIPGRITEGSGSMAGVIVACPIEIPDKSKARKVRVSGPVSVIMKHRYPSKWDGRPKHCSWYA